ncbi:MAG: hypothetical protein GY835_22940 [bacterium]|nr:hypothetical protein [bacterium]
MRFEREGKKPITTVSEAQLRRQLSYKRGGDNTYAIIEDADGSYLQMLGGGVSCCLEWRDMKRRRHYRAFLAVPRVPWKEESLLGSMSIKPEEVLAIEQVTVAFCAFLGSRILPPEIHWRDVTEELAAEGIARPGAPPNTPLERTAGPS